MYSMTSITPTILKGNININFKDTNLSTYLFWLYSVQIIQKLYFPSIDADLVIENRALS